MMALTSHRKSGSARLSKTGFSMSLANCFTCAMLDLGTSISRMPLLPYSNDSVIVLPPFLSLFFSNWAYRLRFVYQGLLVNRLCSLHLLGFFSFQLRLDLGDRLRGFLLGYRSGFRHLLDLEFLGLHLVPDDGEARLGLAFLAPPGRVGEGIQHRRYAAMFGGVGVLVLSPYGPFLSFEVDEFLDDGVTASSVHLLRVEPVYELFPGGVGAI